MNIEIRPIGAWTDPETKGRRSSPFSATEANTMNLLQHELEMLAAKHGVIELVMPSGGLRLDGGLRAATKPEMPGVVLYIESRHGALRYACDQFTKWEDNLRAIALGLEALRKIERYGIAKRGQQYTGWKQLGTGASGMSKAEARAIIDEYGGVRAAIKATHPDAGGSPEAFDRVQRAKKALARA